MRSAWTRFVLSLIYRNPEGINLIKPHMVECWNAAVEGLRANYDSRREPSDPPTFQEYMARTDPVAPHKIAMSLLEDIIDSDRVGTSISNMHWSSITVVGAKHSLLTSDRPMIRPYGLGSGMLFIAAYDEERVKRLAAADPSAVVRFSNSLVVGQARSFVWGVNDGQHRFVENRISRLPDHPILSDAQRQAAIEAARAGPPSSVRPPE
jgi:hypothetical protein